MRPRGDGTADGQYPPPASVWISVRGKMNGPPDSVVRLNVVRRRVERDGPVAAVDASLSSSAAAA